MSIKKKIDLVLLILKLLQEKKLINLQIIAQAAELDAQDASHRRAIQRALAYLIKEGSLVAQGKARARMYSLKTDSASPHEFLKNQPFQIRQEMARYQVDQRFQHIPLSEKSIALLQTIAKPIRSKEPIIYNQDFLRSYIPNESFYLDATLREQLHLVGNAEPITRPAGTYARNILNSLLIDLSWNSSRLEGNTYSLIETKRLIELGEGATGKDALEAQMILNHKNAIEYIVDSVDEIRISAHETYSIHALLSENLLDDPRACGRVRNIIVGVSGTAYAPLQNPHVLQECFEMLVEKLNLIKDPFEQSFFALMHLAYLQAFEDVNKRTGRLVANIPFIKHNLRPLSFIDVKQEDYVLALLGVYEKNDVSLLRDLYSWAYTRSAQRYSGVLQFIGEPTLLKLKYRHHTQEIVRAVVLEKIPGNKVTQKIKDLIGKLNLPETETAKLLQIIEMEIIGLHEGNTAVFKIAPSEFKEWEKLQ